MVLSKTAGSWLSSLGQLMSVLAIFVIVLLLAWLTTRFLVIAVSKDHVEKLAEISKEQLEISTTDAAETKMDMGESFRDILDKVKHHLPKK